MSDMSGNLRASAKIRSRSSVAVVAETRGVPLQVLSLMLAISGLRCILACDTALPGEGDMVKTVLTEMWPECRTNPYQGFSSGIAGAFCLMQSYTRFQTGTCQHVADLYNAMSMLVFSDIIIFYLQLRLYSMIPIFYQAYVGLSLVYEIYVLIAARRAHIARLKMTKISLVDNKSD